MESPTQSAETPKKRNNSLRCGGFGPLFKSGQGDRCLARYSSPMSIVRDDDERQTRVDQMIEQFHKAQSRPLAKATTAKPDDHVVELPRECPGPGGGRPVNSDTDFTRA